MELLSDSEIETKQFHAKDAQSLVFCSQVPQPLLFYTSIKNTENQYTIDALA